MGEERLGKIERVKALLKTAEAAGLDGLDFIDGFDVAVVAREYNGIGPEWAGAEIRGWATDHLGLFQPAAVIHDLRNYVSDGSRSAFDHANIEFLQNCLRLADAAYPWYSPNRYRARTVAYLLHEFVRGPGGWTAWMECHERNLSNHQKRKEQKP